MASVPERQKELDSFVVNVEFLLISVIQGAALATLGVAAAIPFSNLDWLALPYIVSALIFILIFWAQAIVHTISFIKWPIDIIHNLLYFLVGLVEIMVFTQLDNPLRWFGFITLFFVIAGILYVYDLELMRKQKNHFNESEAKRALYKDVIKRQKLELKVFLPMAIVYNALSFYLILRYPGIFITQNYGELLVLIQLLFGLLVMVETLHGFKKRIKLVTNTI